MNEITEFIVIDNQLYKIIYFKLYSYILTYSCVFVHVHVTVLVTAEC